MRYFEVSVLLDCFNIRKKSGFSIFVNFDKLTSIQKHGKVGRYETCVLYDGHASAHLESHVSHGSKSLRWIVEL